MDTSILDDSQYITVRCTHCNTHYPLKNIKDHMDSHSHTTEQEVSEGKPCTLPLFLIYHCIPTCVATAEISDSSESSCTDLIEVNFSKQSAGKGIYTDMACVCRQHVDGVNNLFFCRSADKPSCTRYYAGSIF